MAITYTGKDFWEETFVLSQAIVNVSNEFNQEYTLEKPGHIRSISSAIVENIPYGSLHHVTVNGMTSMDPATYITDTQIGDYIVGIRGTVLSTSTSVSTLAIMVTVQLGK